MLDRYAGEGAKHILSPAIIMGDPGVFLFELQYADNSQLPYDEDIRS